MGHKKTLGRRQFLAKSLAGVTSAGFINLSIKQSTVKTQDQSAHKKKNIIYRILGKTGIRLPIISMGCVNTLNSALVRKSYEIGIRHFDTAAGYTRGLNEEMIGKAIKELSVRDQSYIGTKIYIHHLSNLDSHQVKETSLRIAEESLKRLQTDYIDILYNQNVTSIDELKNPGILEALQLLKEQKKARFIGFSTHRNMAELINKAIPMNFYDVILTTFNYAYCEDKELINTIQTAANKGIGIIAMKTQCTQYSDRSFDKPEPILKYYRGKIMQTAVLKWAMCHSFITTAIPGYANFDQMEEDFSVAYDLEYTDEEKNFLEDRGVKYSMGVCLQCDRCMPTCSKGVDIPTLMRTHMYVACYTNFYLARQALDEIPEGWGLDQCASCDNCQAICQNKIDIAQRIDELKVIYT
jgi:predicted aldo/keto reductase-like oxidoreductase